MLAVVRIAGTTFRGGDDAWTAFLYALYAPYAIGRKNCHGSPQQRNNHVFT